MITQAILSALIGLGTFVVGLFPTVAMPAWVTTLATTIGDGVTQVSQLGHWLPLGALGNVAVFILTVWTAALLVRFLRMALSVMTGGGGSAS